MTDTYRIALAGTGIMGGAMARRWLAAGHDVRVWNRTRRKAEQLADHGATVADSTAEAAEGADYFVTMVADGGAVRSVLDRSDGLLDTLAGQTVWAQMSTVGAEDTDTFAALADDHDIDFIDAPVLGTKGPAESGTLTVLGAADESLRASAEAFFEPIATDTRWVGRPGAATRTKLVCNNWVVGLLGVLSETLALADGLDVPADHFLQAIAGGALDAGYAHIKGEMMQKGDYPTNFPLRLALKDANLILEAARDANLQLSVIEGIANLLERAAQLGYGDQDMAAAFEAARQHLS